MALHQSLGALVGCTITEIFSSHVPAADLTAWEETLQTVLRCQQPQTLTLNVLPEASFGPAAEPPLPSIQESISTSGTQITTDYSAIPYLPFSNVNLKSIIYNLLSNTIKYQVPGRQPVILL